MAFQQGLSGLNSSSKALDVVSNNVANASTVGFKAGNTIFADMYASAMVGGSSGLQIGIGSRVAAVAQSFNQGNLTPTSNSLDMAINGNGFFRMQLSDGSIAYTRNGQFDVNKDGYVINAGRDKLTGFGVLDATASPPVFAGEPSPLYIDTSYISPRETGKASLGVNLDSNSLNPRDAAPPVDIGNFLDAVNIPVDSYNNTTSMKVFDSLGNEHMMSLYFVRQSAGGSPTNDWEVYARLDGDVIPDPANPALSLGTPLTNLGTIRFTTMGTLDISNPTNGVFTNIMQRTGAQLGTGADALSFDLDLTRSTQWNSAFGVTTQPRQDGYTTGRLSGVSVSAEGVLLGTYSNGLSRAIGKLALAEFASPQGLTSLGNNLWAESWDSGQPSVGAPGTGALGTVTSSQIEESNVDLTQELVQMIIQQRNYQANAQSIKTQDQIMSTLVNLR